MSAESMSSSDPNEFVSLSVFPIDERSVGKSIRLLRIMHNNNSQLSTIARIELKHDDPPFSSFLHTMLGIRNELHLHKELGEKYNSGIVFAQELLKEQFTMRNLVLGSASPGAIRTYFNSLLINNQDAVTDPYHINLRHRMLDKTAVTAPAFLRMQHDDSEKKPVTSLEFVNNTFITKSFSMVEQMWDQEPRLKEGIPVLIDILGSDGFSGFTMGMADFYWPHQIDQTIGPYAEVLDGLEA